MTLPSPTDKKLIDLLEKLARIKVTYPCHLLDATRAKFVARFAKQIVNQKAEQVAAHSAGS